MIFTIMHLKLIIMMLNAIEKFEIFDRDYVLSKVYACRLLGDD